MKLSTKLAAGFGSVVALTAVLGGFSVYVMRDAAITATTLAEDLMPQIEVGNDIGDLVARARFDSRVYSLTGDRKALDGTRASLNSLRQEIKKAQDFTAARPQMTAEAELIRSAAIGVEDYAKLIDETERAINGIASSSKLMDDEARNIVSNIEQLQLHQAALMEKEIGANAGTAKLQERREKMVLTARLRNTINQMRIDAQKGQVTHDLKLLGEGVKKYDEVSAITGKLRSTLIDPVDIKELETIEKSAGQYRDAIAAVAQQFESLADIGSRRTGVAAKVNKSTDELIEKAIVTAGTASTESEMTLGTSSTLQVIGTTIAVLVGATLAVVIGRGITKPINRAVNSLREGSQQVASASSQVAGSSQSLAQGASEQAAALEETTSALEEMSSMTRKNADTAQQAAALSEQTKASADKSNQAMHRMAEAINDIQQSAAETAKIIKVIDEIAFQTNLLALNAAVEAARAGEAGKGFAVVAEEVRNLAMRSAEAAKNTSSMIEDSVNNSKKGVEISEEVAKALAEITTASTRMNSLVAEIAAASKEQAQGIGQINGSVSQMDKVTQSAAANAEETAAASEELSAQAEQMAAVVGDLAAIVGSVRPAVGARRAARVETHEPSSLVTAMPSQPAKKHAATKAAKSTPAMEFPLDDNELSGNFDDFSRRAA